MVGESRWRGARRGLLDPGYRGGPGRGARPGLEAGRERRGRPRSAPLAQENNHHGPEGARALAGALEKMAGMQMLNLVSERVRYQ